MDTDTKAKPKFKIVSRAELKQKLDQKDNFALWNVLTKEYYNANRNIPGSKWVPVNELPQQLSQLGIDKNKEIVVYCASFTCRSSKQAAEILAGQGYTNVSAYEGGLADWEEGGLPLVQI